MDCKKAKEIIEDMIKNRENTEDEAEALRQAKKVLEMQTKARPVLKSGTLDRYICPECGQNLTTWVYEGIPYGYEFCSHCSKAIRWEEK